MQVSIKSHRKGKKAVSLKQGTTSSEAHSSNYRQCQARNNLTYYVENIGG